MFTQNDKILKNYKTGDITHHFNLVMSTLKKKYNIKNGKKGDIIKEGYMTKVVFNYSMQI